MIIINKSIRWQLKWLYTEYVEEIFQEYQSSSKDELEEAARKLKNMNPAPVNTMLQEQPREENQGVKNGCGRCPSYQPTG